MKKKPSKPAMDELRTEYDLSRLRGRVQGKHFAKYRQGTNFTLLDPDVRAAFPSDDAVNKALRSLMKATKAGRS
jgi:hypothetical protein